MSIEDRKTDHLRLCLEDDVEYRGKTTLLDDVELLHDSLPELAIDEIDLTTSLVSKTLSAPLLITGMTGGAEQAREINRTLARVAQELGIAFGVGSQRAMLKNDALASTYQVRDVAPDIVLFGNIGAVQLAELSIAETEDLVSTIGADALCVHLNPGQELIQPEGDRDFRGCLDAVGEVADALSVPVIAKETGCGMSRRTLERLKSAGVQIVDVSGAGGTTWIGVETKRAPSYQQTIGEWFWDWGVPTAASIRFARDEQFTVIASGGLRSALDAVKALSLGASIAGMARPWLVAAMEGGEEQALEFGRTLIEGLRVGCALTGSNDIASLRDAPKVIGPRLERWLNAGA